MQWQFAGFYEGHRATVLSLAGSLQHRYFFSVAADGLLVKWDINQPNEGQVLTRISSLMPAICYLPDDTLVVAVNHKGLLTLNAQTGAKQQFCDLASVSVKKLILAGSWLLVLTTANELLWVEAATLNLMHRWQCRETLTDIVLLGQKIWVATASGLLQFSLNMGESEAITLLKNIQQLLPWDEKSFLARSANSITKCTVKKGMAMANYPFTFNADTKVYGGRLKNKFGLLMVDNTSGKWFDLKKGSLNLHIEVKNPHNANINDLLWIENYKFAITAGADARIGIWQCY